jgi:hypothetical protein
MIKHLFFWILLLYGASAMQAQEKFAIDLGSGLSDAEGFAGINIDGQMTFIYKRWHIGPVFHFMNMFEQINPSADAYIYIFEAIPERGENAFGYSYTMNWQRSQAHLGLLLGYDVVRGDRFRLNLSAGYGLNRYREMRFVENYLNPNAPSLWFGARNENTFNANFGLTATYDVYKTLSVGTRIRHVRGTGSDVSYNFLVGIRI